MILLLAFMLSCVVGIPTALAQADVFTEVVRDAGSDTQTMVMPLPPEFDPFTEMRWTSTITWKNLMISHFALDGHWNMHWNGKYVSEGTVHNEIWYWDSVSEEWIYVTEWSQKLAIVSGSNELVTFDIQTSKNLDVSREQYEMTLVDPWTGETTTFEYMVLRYMIVKYVNGELQFENEWEIWKE